MQHYMANLIEVQCVITSHAEVWTCQFWWEFYQLLTVAMIQVPEGTVVSTQGQLYVQYKEGHADQRRFFKLSSDCLRFVNWTIDIASIRTLACSILWGCERQFFLN